MRLAELRCLAMACFLLGTPACSPTENNLLVSVKSLPTRAASLSVTAKLNEMLSTTSMPTQTLTTSLDRFGVNIPAETSGQLRLNLQAFDNDGCLQGTGTVEVRLPAGRTDISISMVAQTPRQCGSLLPCSQMSICSFNSQLSTDWTGIWAISPTDVWAVGNRSVVAHYDGSSWQSMLVPDVLGDQTDLKGIWASATNDVWTVGSKGRTFHYDGTKWLQIPNSASSSNELAAIWGIHSTDVWAVGGNPDGTQEFQHWDGQNWSPVLTTIPGQLFGVWASSSSDIYAAGLTKGTSPQGMLIHFDGANWQFIITNTDKTLRAIWGDGANLVFIVGIQGTFLRWNASKHNLFKVSQPGTNAFLQGVIGDGNAVYAVSDHGGISNLIKGLAPFDSFAAQSTGNLADLTAISLSRDGIGWVAGSSGFLGYLDTRP